MTEPAFTSSARPSAVVGGERVTGRLWAGGAQLVACFPAAGSSALSFRPLANAFAADVTVIALEAKRGSAGSSPGVPHLADALAEQLRALLTDNAGLSRDVVLLGHSFGGYLAFEVAQRLHGCGRAPDLRLVLVGCAAPTGRSPAPPTGDDDVLIGSLTSLGALPEALRREPALLRQYLPAIRADLLTVERYVRGFRVARRLPVPTLAIRGIADSVVSLAALAGWRELCHPASLRCMPGDHYLPQRAPTDLAAQVQRFAAAARAA